MAATVSIVVQAINATKAVFTEVGAQTVQLNKKINALGGLFKGVFATGLVANTIKDLIGLSSQIDEVTKTSDRLKSTWLKVGEDLGDGLATTFLSLEKPLNAIGKMVEKAVGLVQGYYAFFGALSAGSSFKEALDIAKNFSAEIEKEQLARKAIVETTKNQKQLDEDRLKTEENIVKLQETLSDKRQKNYEDSLSKEDLLHEKRKREGELNAIIQATASTKEQILEAEIEREDVLKDIIKLEGDLGKEREANAKKMEEDWADFEQAVVDDWKEQETARLEASYERIQSVTQAEIDSLKEQAAKAKQNAQELRDARLRIVGLVTDKEARRAAKEEEKEKARQERKLQAIIKEAEKKEELIQQGFNRELTAVEQLAIAAREIGKGADEEIKKSVALELAAEEKQRKMELYLENIRDKINEVLAFK